MRVNKNDGDRDENDDADSDDKTDARGATADDKEQKAKRDAATRIKARIAEAPIHKVVSMLKTISKEGRAVRKEWRGVEVRIGRAWEAARTTDLDGRAADTELATAKAAAKAMDEMVKDRQRDEDEKL